MNNLLDSVKDTDWYGDISATERKYQAGEITGAERYISNVAANARALYAPIDAAVSFGFQSLPETAQQGLMSAAGAAGDFIQSTAAYQSAQELAREYPRTAAVASDLMDIASVVPLARAPSMLKSGLSETALSMNTMIPENYSKFPGAELYGSVKTFAQAAPAAVAGAFDPRAQAVLRETGVAQRKARGEIGAGTSERNISLGSALTSAALSKQTGRGESLIEAGPIGKSNFHGSLKANDTEGLRSAIFIDNKNTRGSIPKSVQDRALNHLLRDKAVKKNLQQTDILIKRNLGPDKFGQEGLLGTPESMANPVMSALNASPTLKGSLSEWVKQNKVPRGKKGDRATIEKARKSLTARDMQEYFIYYNKTHPNRTPVTFRKGEGDDPFYYFQSDHNSRAKELGGVNMFMAMNPKTGQLITMMSDKHDLRGIDPPGGTPMLNVSPAQVSNFKADAGKRFTLNKKKTAEQKREKEQSRKESVAVVEERTGVKKNKQESELGYHYRAMREARIKPKAQDFAKVGGRVGMLGLVAEGLQTEEVEEQ